MDSWIIAPGMIGYLAGTLITGTVWFFCARDFFNNLSDSDSEIP